jgi:hypothetical protein
MMKYTPRGWVASSVECGAAESSVVAVGVAAGAVPASGTGDWGHGLPGVETSCKLWFRG